MEKLNIAEILKDCPSGMELDCTICDNVYLDEVTPHMIKCFIKNKNDVYNTIYFHNDGTYLTTQNAKCVIFPKGKTTWEGFQRPFKEGDILTTNLGSIFILKTPDINNFCYGCYVALNDVHRLVINNPRFCIKSGIRLSTEEEKQKLFDAIKANGYKWNAETKTLEKLIEPKFKVGDVIQDVDTYKVKITEVNIEDECYGYESMITKGIGSIGFSEQDDWALVPNKFDIITLKAFDKVLTRTTTGDIWSNNFFGYYKDGLCHCSGNYAYRYFIPYKGNEHLLGTKNDCDDYYKTWK